MTQPEPIIDAVYRKLGGRRVIGRDIASEADLAQLVLARIPERAVAAVQGTSFADREIERFVIPARHAALPARAPGTAHGGGIGSIGSPSEGPGPRRGCFWRHQKGR